MIRIPSNEIKQPQLHADSLGFTFLWKGHFLRGIYPQSEGLAKSYFETGFLDEIVSCGYFPKTWISEYENEQFCMILEHELIQPIMFATEWNFSMLKGAALMVLDIAQIAWWYGYNMVDCHKLNVMFKGTEPVYVDMGSFVPREDGCSGWLPYMTFLSSYFYIIDLWSDGAEQLAKRMMAPGVTFNDIDYYIYKSFLCRRFPALASLRLCFKTNLVRLASSSTEKIEQKTHSVSNRVEAFLLKFFHQCVCSLKLSPSQHLPSLYRKIERKKTIRYDRNKGALVNISEVQDVIERMGTQSSITFIDSPIEIWREVCKGSQKVISIQQNPKVSDVEYQKIRTFGDSHFTTASIYLLNGAITIPGKLPESRLSSDLVAILGYRIPSGTFGIHNAIVFFERCRSFSTSGKMIVNVSNCTEAQKETLLNSFFTENIGDTFILNTIR